MSLLSELNELTILATHTLNNEQRESAAELVYQALPQYYDLLGLGTTQRVALLASCLQNERSDLFNTTHAFIEKAENSLIGIHTSFPASELNSRQSLGLLAILDFFKEPPNIEILSSLKHFSRRISTQVPVDSFYLSRFTISESFRGTPAATLVLEDFFHKGKDYPNYSLHVFRENHRAIRFYEKQGFTSIPETDTGIQYQIMQRPNPLH